MKAAAGGETSKRREGRVGEEVMTEEEQGLGIGALEDAMKELSDKRPAERLFQKIYKLTSGGHSIWVTIEIEGASTLGNRGART